MADFRKVVIGPKVDLDVCGALLCASYGNEPYLDIEGSFPIEVVRTGRASEADLADPLVLCIEVGGGGRVAESNFDHHEAGGPSWSATQQACDVFIHEAPGVVELVRFIDRLDTEGPRAFGSRREGVYLTDLFSGMLLTERDPVAQVRKGVRLLTDFLNGRCDPMEPLDTEMWYMLRPEYRRWAEAKAENNCLLAETIARAEWGATKSGRRLAWLESNFFGAPGALYAHGAEIAVVFNPRFGNPPVRKFTVAGNNVAVSGSLERLNALESGWGGPATGTIVGSPREGSALTLEQVVEVVRETL